MNRSSRIVFLLLAILALFVVTYDYEFGHLGEDLLHPEWCPICYVFHSTELGHLFAVFLLFVGILSLLGFVCYTSSFSVSSIEVTQSLPRAPPAC